MMLLALQSGLRASKFIGLNCPDVTLGDGANVRCERKGRKHRAVPLTGSVINLVQGWLSERAGRPGDPLFCTRSGRRLSGDAVALCVRTHGAAAAEHCPSLAGMTIHPHLAALSLDSLDSFLECHRVSMGHIKVDFRQLTGTARRFGDYTETHSEPG